MELKLKKIKDIVKKCLAENEKARNSDWILFKDVCNKLDIKTDNITVSDMCENHEALGFPSFESVRRSRQKIQEKGYFLPTENIRKCRNTQEHEYYEVFGLSRR